MSKQSPRFIVEQAPDGSFGLFPWCWKHDSAEAWRGGYPFRWMAWLAAWWATR
jgi:hypothetical protein